MAADANLLRERWDANKKKVSARENSERDASEVDRRCLEVEAKSHQAQTAAARRQATESFRESLELEHRKSREMMQQRLKDKKEFAKQVREERRRLIEEAAEKEHKALEELRARREEAAARSQKERTEHVAEDLVHNVVHKAMLSQGSAFCDDGGPLSPVASPRGNHSRSHASLASSLGASGPGFENADVPLECPRERWKKVKPPPVHCPWQLAKTHGLYRRRPRKQVQLRSVVEPDNVQADPADIWQDIYRAAVGRAAHGEGFLAQEDVQRLRKVLDVPKSSGTRPATWPPGLMVDASVSKAVLSRSTKSFENVAVSGHRLKPTAGSSAGMKLGWTGSSAGPLFLTASSKGK